MVSRNNAPVQRVVSGALWPPGFIARFGRRAAPAPINGSINTTHPRRILRVETNFPVIFGTCEPRWATRPKIGITLIKTL
jgi:hypothetical protein